MSASARRVQRGTAPHRPLLGGVLVAGMAIVLAVALLRVPREGAPLPAVARQALEIALPRWHMTEPVNEVVYGTRGFDTFGETFLLLAAVVSVVLLTRRRESADAGGGEEAAGRREQLEVDPARSRADRWERLARSAEGAEAGAGGIARVPDRVALGTPGPEEAQAMTVIVRTAARTAATVLAIAGVYLAAWGFSPGGGFPAGAVLLGVVLLIYAGYGYRRVEPLVRSERVELAELAGAALIIAVVVLGLVLRGSVTRNFLPLASDPTTILSGGTLQAMSGAEVIEVATGLILAIFALLGMRHDWAGRGDRT